MLFRISPSAHRVLGAIVLTVLLGACDSEGAPMRAASPPPEATSTPHATEATGAQTKEAASRGSATARITLHGVDLTGIGYDVGDPSASVTVVEFSDFGCPFCAMYAMQTYPVLEKEFIETGKVFYKYVPFVMGTFPNGDRAARAAECAAEQGSFWPMHDRLYAGQRDWKGRRDADLLFGQYAAETELDVARFTSCYGEDRRAAHLSSHNQAASRLGVRATPTFFINGQQAEGALPLDVFRDVLKQMAEGR